ncbi:MAG TPA: hypothetical protein VJ739_11895, partial [Gemmataceae bacterium]|nr:hypothetical protein [Gemmataceae bacterium]
RRLQSRSLVLVPRSTAGSLVFLNAPFTANDRFAVLYVVGATDAAGASVPLGTAVVNVTPQRHRP